MFPEAGITEQQKEDLGRLHTAGLSFSKIGFGTDWGDNTVGNNRWHCQAGKLVNQVFSI